MSTVMILTTLTRGGPGRLGAGARSVVASDRGLSAIRHLPSLLSLTPAVAGWCPCGVAGGAGLVGRVVELRAVSALLSGESDVAGMLVVGEAGVGKSRLIIAAAAE